MKTIIMMTLFLVAQNQPTPPPKPPQPPKQEQKRPDPPKKDFPHPGPLASWVWTLAVQS